MKFTVYNIIHCKREQVRLTAANAAMEYKDIPENLIARSAAEIKLFKLLSLFNRQIIWSTVGSLPYLVLDKRIIRDTTVVESPVQNGLNESEIAVDSFQSLSAGFHPRSQPSARTEG